MSEADRVKMVEVGLKWNEVTLDPEIIEKVIHVVDVVSRNGDSVTLKSLKFNK